MYPANVRTVWTLDCLPLPPLYPKLYRPSYHALPTPCHPEPRFCTNPIFMICPAVVARSRQCTGPRAPTPETFAEALFNDNSSWAVTDRQGYYIERWSPPTSCPSRLVFRDGLSPPPISPRKPPTTCLDLCTSSLVLFCRKCNENILRIESDRTMT